MQHYIFYVTFKTCRCMTFLVTSGIRSILKILGCIFFQETSTSAVENHHLSMMSGQQWDSFFEQMAVQHLHSWLIFGTFILCLIAALLHIIAFATSSWLVSDGNSPFVRLGWHEACFNNCHFPYCPGGDRDIVYNNCYVWTFNEMIMIDERFREIKDWLMPGENLLIP